MWVRFPLRLQESPFSLPFNALLINPIVKMIKQQILIIEDDLHLRKNMEDALTLAGYEVITASNGEEGLMLIERHKPTLVLCDVVMPVLGGIEVAQKLRSDYTYDDVSFIFITVANKVEQIRKGMKIGADDYITKPFSIDELLESIKARLTRFDRIRKSISKGSSYTKITNQYAVLTPSEKRIIKLVASGTSTREISQQLSISEKTVENHRQNIVFKLDLEGKNSLLKYALEHKEILISL